MYNQGMADGILIEVVDIVRGYEETLGEFLANEINRKKISNRALATGAGVSESVIRNLLQHGLNAKAKDPDPRTLSAVAQYLGIDRLKLFQLAGYIGPEVDAHSIRADIIASVYDLLPRDKQEIVIALIDALAVDVQSELPMIKLREAREDTGPLAGFDVGSPHVLMMIANDLIVQLGAIDANDFYSKATKIDPDLKLFRGITWSSLGEQTRVRIIGLARAKLNLKYDPAMVDLG